MPPRGSEGYDFTPILTHYLFLFTTILAVVSLTLKYLPNLPLIQAFPNADRMVRSLHRASSSNCTK